MGSEVEDDEFKDVENTVYVAVGKNVKESNLLILWAVQFFHGIKNICLLYVHQPAQLVTILVDKFSASRLKEQVVKACCELEQTKMHNILNQFMASSNEGGKGEFWVTGQNVQVHAGKVWIEAESVEAGILQTITHYDIRWLVMGAAAKKHRSKDMSHSKSRKAVYVSQQAPMSCQIWFVCKGQLIHTRERSASPTPHLRSIRALPPPPAAEETMLTIYDEEGANMEVRSLQCLETSTSTKNGFSTSKSTHLLIGDVRENASTLASSHESQDKLACSLSAMFLEGPKRLSSSELQDKLAHATTDAENSKQIAFEESIKRWRAEEDAKEALHKAEESENSYKEEVTLRKEMETILATKSQEIETMKNQRVQFIEELQIVKNQKPGLLDRISKAHEAEKELEEKIIQAVNLLITFKERRDSLQDECDNARRQINTLAKFVNEDNAQLSHAEFYKPSFLEIMKATEDFNQSLKIGEGRCGSVYKGILRHVKVAIKMLPSLGSLGDKDFEDAAEVLSRIRHPNIVTLIGVCPESRSLIYEYLENGNLEDHIASRATAPPLQWHTRIRIASEMCSALIFLHGSKPRIIHGDLKLTNILLDSNHVCKLSDLGISRLSFYEDKVSPTSLYNNIEPEVSAYMDPELFESGKLSTSSDIYSFGVVLLRILTGRPALSIINDTKCALENGNFVTILDSSGGDWPIEHAKELAYLGLRCCEKNPMNRPDLVNEILTKLETMRNLVIPESPVESENRRRIPSYFVCPIFQEVMKDPYIAADGFTYEGDAIKGWLNSGHKTSPMTNLKLDHCDLLPNHALSYAIQEWQQHS